MAQLGITARATLQALFASIVIVSTGSVTAALLGWIMLETFGSVTLFFVYTFAITALLFFGAAAIAGHCAARLDRAHPMLSAALTAIPIGLATSFIFGHDMFVSLILVFASVAIATLVAAENK
jgi:hypothetical protein